MSMLLIAGSERNPGPLSDSSASSSDSIISAEEQAIQDKFSVVRYNVQSILNKLDLIETELRYFDVISITESWLDQRTSDEDLKLNGYTLFRRDRVGDNHGCICIYVRENIYSCRRNDIELPNIECVRVEVMVHNRKQLLSRFNRPPNSPNAVMTAIEDFIGLALTQTSRPF